MQFWAQGTFSHIGIVHHAKNRIPLPYEKFLYIHAKCVGSVVSKRKDHCFIYIFLKKLNQHSPILNQHSQAVSSKITSTSSQPPANDSGSSVDTGCIASQIHSAYFLDADHGTVSKLSVL